MMSGFPRTTSPSKPPTAWVWCLSVVAVIAVTLACGPIARAQRPPQTASTPYVPHASPAALAAFSPQLKSFGGRWSDGNCELRWNDWAISGLEITFHDQSGGLDVERVVDLQAGAFVTQSVATSHGAAPSFWNYQPVSPDILRVQNVSRGMSFSLRRCPPSAGTVTAANPSAGGTTTAAPSLGTSTAPVSPHALPTQVVRNDIANLSAGSNAAQNAMGPSFDCQKARDPVAATICSDPTLKLIDLEFNQAYQALRFQLPEDQRSTLRQDGIAFGQSMIEACQLPSKGVPNAATMARAVPCLAQAYRSKRTEYLGRLSSDAAQEAWRGMPRHIALQNRLVETGMIAASGPVDGVYGSATRDAITRFQKQQGLAPSGFMTDVTADALTRAAHPDPDTTNADLEAARKEVEASRRQIEESQKRIAAMLAGDDASPHLDNANADLEAARKQAEVEASNKQIEERRKAIAAALAEAPPSSRVADPGAEKDRSQREAANAANERAKTEAASSVARDAEAQRQAQVEHRDQQDAQAVTNERLNRDTQSEKAESQKQTEASDKQSLMSSILGYFQSGPSNLQIWQQIAKQPEGTYIRA